MKITNLKFTTRYLIYVSIFVVLIGIIIRAPFFNIKNQRTVFEPKIVLQNIKESDLDVFMEIERTIDKIIFDYGPQAGLVLIKEAERQKEISNDDCHSLLHLVGHEAYFYYGGDFEKILSVVSHGAECIGAYIHGVEAQIVLSSTRVVNDLKDFCTLTKRHKVGNGPCYHGAGHSFMDSTHDTGKSLSSCDALEGGSEDDLTNCYRGVFSETGNAVVGYDGHTGLPIKPMSFANLDRNHPYLFCQLFLEKYRASCYSQLTKIFFSPDITESFLKCIDPLHNQEMQEICVRIITGIYARVELSSQNSVILPSIINDFSEELKRASIMGALETFLGYKADGDEKEWVSFCNSYYQKEDYEFCVQTFQKEMVKITP